tara:strand:- start:142 stop:510 length:369 start_codon:yes stop_codon:yes gene_type:complete
MTDKNSKWNTTYMSNYLGKPLKISEMSINQVNGNLRFCKQRLVVLANNMDGLYERRFTLLKDEQDYTRKNTKQKIVQCLGLKNQVGESKRLKEILNLTLQYLEDDKPIEMIKAILEQARDDE